MNTDSLNLDFVKKAAEDYKKMADNFRLPLTHLQNLAKQMDDSLEPIRAASRALAEQHLAITKAFKTFDALLPRIDEFQNFLRQAKEVFERDKELRNAIIKSGWWLTPSLMSLPYGTLSRAAKKYTTGGSRAITSMFFSVYHSNQNQLLENTVSSWNSNKFFKPWEKTIKQALKAHVNGDYSLSIPTLLVVAEGVANKYCSIRMKGVKIGRNHGNEKISKALRRSGLDNADVQKDLEMLDIDIFFAAIDSKVYGDTKSLRKTRGFRHLLNRHAVFHGISPHYGTQKNSLQCFMLLDVMSLLR